MRPIPTRSGPSDSSVRGALSAALLALAAAGCATTGAARSPAGRQAVDDPMLGWSVELPSAGRFAPGLREGEVARSPSGVSVQVRAEHFAADVGEDACWERLAKRLKAASPPENIPPAARDAASLRAAARTGLEADGRRRHLSVHPRGRTCLVLEVDGPTVAPELAETAAMAAETFQPRAPAAEAGPRLAAEAGMQLFDLGEHVAAAERFEEALVADPIDPQLHLAAGVAAYFAGPSEARRAVDHLERALSLRGEAERRGSGIEENRLRNALMYLGLARASLREFGPAVERLAELVVRFPDDAVGRYNFACVLALSGDADNALVHLGEAVRREPGLARHARDDEDLLSLHARPEWSAIVETPAPTR